MRTGPGIAAIVGVLLLAGSAVAHLVPGDPPHLDLETDPYVAGETLTLRLFVSNPTTAWANYSWTNSCVLMGSVVSERRTLAAWTYPAICLTVMMGIQVPPNASVLWFVFDFDTLPDDGCVDAWISLRGYPVSGETHVCPGPAEPPPSEMTLVVFAPSAVAEGEAFDLSANVRTPEGEPVAGILVTATLGDVELGAATTGTDGRVAMTAQAPDVTNTTLTPLTVRASGEGWQNVSRTQMVTVFPTTSERLLLRASLVTGDVIESGGFAILEVLVLGSGARPVANASLDIEVESPLLLEDRTDLDGSRYILTLRAADVPEGVVASVRLVANAPGFDGAQAVVDYAIVPVVSDLPNLPPAREEPAPVALFATLGIAGISAAGLAVWRRRRAAHRRKPDGRRH